MRTGPIGAGAIALAITCGGDRGSADGDGSADASGESTADGSASASASESGGSGSASTSTSDSSGGPGGTGLAEEGPIFDIGMPDSPGGGECLEQCGENRWSYIFIANSGEATLSKIDTRTLVEEGRYQTRPDGSGNPSRTSVSIDARAVAIANRMGGVTKFWALPSDCEDKNVNGMIDTSTGAGDVRPFADEECVAWHTPFPEATTQRPVAWTSGVYNPQTCTYDRSSSSGAAHGRHLRAPFAGRNA